MGEEPLMGEVTSESMALVAVRFRDLPPPRCRECRFWNSGTSLAGHDDTGRCQLKAPVADDRTGLARWPYTDQYDSCHEGVFTRSDLKFAVEMADRRALRDAEPDDEIPF
jgi:hypothetical protein